MTLPRRSFTSLTVSLSISDGEDSTQLGFPRWQVNRATLQIVAALVGQGAGVMFGHDWRDDGVMEAVHDFARQMQPPDPLSASDARLTGQPLLCNFLAWPDEPQLSHEDRERLASTLHVQQVGLPRELHPYEAQARAAPSDSPLYRYARARALTQLRRELSARCSARVCLGGRRTGSQGRYPGVIEEALFAIDHRKPLYLSGLLGGATVQLIRAIEGESLPAEFCPPTSLEDTYAFPPVTGLHPTAFHSDAAIDREGVWRSFVRTGIAGLSRANGLSADENTELFRTPALSRVIELMLIGLSRTHPPRGD